jgi:hypothetical protein
MRHCTLICTVACVLIGLGFASLLYAPERIRVEDIHREARERLKTVRGLTALKREEIGTKLNRTPLDVLINARGQKQFVDELDVTPEQRQEIVENVLELFNELVGPEAGTLFLSFYFKTPPPGKLSAVYVSFSGHLKSGTGIVGEKRFFAMTQPHSSASGRNP